MALTDLWPERLIVAAYVSKFWHVSLNPRTINRQLPPTFPSITLHVMTHLAPINVMGPAAKPSLETTQTINLLNLGFANLLVILLDLLLCHIPMEFALKSFKIRMSKYAAFMWCCICKFVTPIDE